MCINTFYVGIWAFNIEIGSSAVDHCVPRRQCGEAVQQLQPTAQNCQGTQNRNSEGKQIYEIIS